MTYEEITSDFEVVDNASYVLKTLQRILS